MTVLSHSPWRARSFVFPSSARDGFLVRVSVVCALLAGLADADAAGRATLRTQQPATALHEMDPAELLAEPDRVEVSSSAFGEVFRELLSVLAWGALATISKQERLHPVGNPFAAPLALACGCALVATLGEVELPSGCSKLFAEASKKQGLAEGLGAGRSKDGWACGAADNQQSQAADRGATGVSPRALPLGRAPTLCDLRSPAPLSQSTRLAHDDPERARKQIAAFPSVPACLLGPVPQVDSTAEKSNLAFPEASIIDNFLKRTL